MSTVNRRKGKNLHLKKMFPNKPKTKAEGKDGPSLRGKGDAGREEPNSNWGVSNPVLLGESCKVDPKSETHNTNRGGGKKRREKRR